MPAVFQVMGQLESFPFNVIEVSVTMETWSTWNVKERTFKSVKIADLLDNDRNVVYIDKKKKLVDKAATARLRADNERIIRSIRRFPGFIHFI